LPVLRWAPYLGDPLPRVDERARSRQPRAGGGARRAAAGALAALRCDTEAAADGSQAGTTAVGWGRRATYARAELSLKKSSSSAAAKPSSAEVASGVLPCI
jgi:hypothetical protein